MEVTGESRRGEREFIDYLLIYRNVPLAMVEAKGNKHPLGGGMQQALVYAEMLDVPFVYSANGDSFLEHDRLAVYGPVETELSDDDLPSPTEPWRRYQLARALSPGARTSAPACTLPGNERS